MGLPLNEGFFFVRRIGMTKPPVKLGVIGQKVLLFQSQRLVNSRS